MPEPKLSKKTGDIAAEEQFDVQITRWGVLLVKNAPEIADGVLKVQGMKCNGSKPTEKVEIMVFKEEAAAMREIAARSRSIGCPRANAILKTEHNYVMERLAQAILEAREE